MRQTFGAIFYFGELTLNGSSSATFKTHRSASAKRLQDINCLDACLILSPVLFFVCVSFCSFFKMISAVLRRGVLRPALSFNLARCYASKSFPPHTVVTMPALSPTMTAGNIGQWQKKPGDAIVPGDVLVEIETDKAQMDFEFQEEGVLAKILKESGEKDVAVGNV
jgi:hypothetical protein